MLQVVHPGQLRANVRRLRGGVSAALAAAADVVATRAVAVAADILLCRQLRCMRRPLGVIVRRPPLPYKSIK